MRHKPNFTLWTVCFFLAALALTLAVGGVIPAPAASLSMLKVLLFGSIMLGCLALANALHERRFN